MIIFTKNGVVQLAFRSEMPDLTVYCFEVIGSRRYKKYLSECLDNLIALPVEYIV